LEKYEKMEKKFCWFCEENDEKKISERDQKVFQENF
jgi:hypothetical protein